MNKKLFTLPLISAALLAACSEQPEKQPAASCNDPTLLQNVRDTLQQTIKQEARRLAQNDPRQYTDADKIIAAASDLNISLADTAAANTGAGSTACTATLTIRIPENILTSARENQPLIYDQQDVNAILQPYTQTGTLSYQASDGSFRQALHYKLNNTQNAPPNITYTDNGLNNAARAVTATLLPYGVKNILVVDGQTISREAALVAQLTAPDASATPPFNHPQDILDNNSASGVFASGVPASAPPPENLQPIPTVPINTISPVELDQARNNNRTANNDINQAWSRLDPMVQKELLTEQRSWIDKKNSDCRAAAARADSNNEAEYLRLQCDTRMTRERNQYLKGYSIP